MKFLPNEYWNELNNVLSFVKLKIYWKFIWGQNVIYLLQVNI